MDAARPPTGRKMKARAPPPPGPAATPDGPRAPSPQRQQSPRLAQENVRDRAVELTVVLPGGLERRSVVSGSHAVMDLLVELCLQNHLNPSHHSLELWAPGTQRPLSFKPNTPLGSLDVHTALLREKRPSEKARPGPAPPPEKSVRLVVNYLRTQKAVVRVSPEAPLHSLLPVICAKCAVSPEHVVLLRDNVAGEALELSKSLGELGIRELYAWDNQRVLLTKTQSEPSLRCREAFRKSSVGSGELDKEKKKFLGFFRVNRSDGKVEPGRPPGPDSDEDSAKLAPGRGSQGSLTTPNSPSVNSRSVTLGTSLSLSNISGVSAKSDVKKRRAPPPPSLPGAGPPAPDRAAEKMSLGSQSDLQRKKRRAPAPPPSPRVPLRTKDPEEDRAEDREENRKSTMGGGRQVPQKPPRGTARGPPQLLLPPPPPYPPPDTDGPEPLGSPGEGAAPEAADLRPTPGLPPGPGGPRAEPAEAEAEETVSVSSCLASEDTTEDSGVLSAPSDILSLDSQHGSTKSRDRWAPDQEEGSDQDPGAPRSPAWAGDGAGHWHSRAERAGAAPEAGGGLPLPGPWERTLAGLDEDLEGLDDSYETDSSSVTGSLGSASGGRVQDAIRAGEAEAIPVTFIGEVPDDPSDPGPLSNSNNNAGCSHRGSAAGGWTPQPGRSRPEGPGAPTAPRDAPKEVRAASPDPREDVNPMRPEPRATWEPPGHDQEPGPGRGPEDRKGAAGPPSWSQRGPAPGGSFGLRHGLTTYKIVPPRSERRCYDPGVSLSTGAIAIDELGNLVSPPGGGRRATASAAPEDTQPPGHVRALARAGSPEKLPGRPPSATATATATATAKQHPAGGLAAEPGPPAPARTSSSQQPAAGQGQGEGPSPQPLAAAGHTKVPAASAPHVLFLKPQRRTSSQYVASAIAKRMAPPRAQANRAGRPGRARKPWEDELPRARRDPTAPGPRLGPHACTEEAVAPSLRSGPHACTEEAEAQAPCGRPSTAHGREPAEPEAGAPPQGSGSSPLGGPPAQDCAVGAPLGPSRPLAAATAAATRRDRGPVVPGCGAGRKQSPSDRDPAGTRSPPPRPGEDRAPGWSLVNGSRGAPEHSEPPAAPRTARSDSSPEPEGRPGVRCTEIREDGPPTTSIFGPKKRFRPVVQRPAPKDTSLHSALMEAIHAAGGRDGLRRTPEPRPEGGPRKPAYVEAESEHAALLAAIRGHRGACSLRKVASGASEELRSSREAARAEPEPPGPGDPGGQPAPALPPPPPPAAPAPPPAARTAPRAGAGALGTPVDARQALMDAIRSGTGAARLRKVPLLV